MFIMVNGNRSAKYAARQAQNETGDKYTKVLKSKSNNDSLVPKGFERLDEDVRPHHDSFLTSRSYYSRPSSFTEFFDDPEFDSHILKDENGEVLVSPDKEIVVINSMIYGGGAHLVTPLDTDGDTHLLDDVIDECWENPVMIAEIRELNFSKESETFSLSVIRFQDM